MDKKFKIGDKVKVVRKDVAHSSPEMDVYIGLQGVIIALDGHWCVKFDDGEFWYFTGTGLEHVKEKEADKTKPLFKFNIGDRVKVVAAKVAGQYGGWSLNMNKAEGKIFTISEILKNALWGDKEAIGYKFKEDREFSWDERCLKRVRKAIVAPAGALNPVKPPAHQAAIMEAPMPLVEPPRAIRTEFRVGDEVVCIEVPLQGGPLAADKVYVITQIGHYVQVDGVYDNYYPRRFKHAKVYYEEQQDVAAVAPVALVKEKKPTLLETLRKKTGDDPGVCSYGVEIADGSFRMHVRDICHARIPQGTNEGDVVKLALDIKGHSLSFKDGLEPRYHEYVNYVMNYSPWSPVFHRKGLDNALTYGILLDVEKPMYQCQAAAVVLREGSEYCNKLDLFSILLNKGYSGNTAYLLSAAVLGPLGALTFSGLDNSHKVLSGRQNAEKLFAFFRDGYVVLKDDKPYRTDHRFSSGIYKYIAPDAVVEKQINRVLKQGLCVKGGDGWAADYSIKDVAFFAYADKLEGLLNNN